MYTSRRSFLKSNAVLLTGALLMRNQVFAAAPAKNLVGIQLYSIRDDMKKDPLGTLKKLSAMGYRNVEHANYVNRKFYGYSAKEFKKILRDLGMKMPSGHTVMGKPHWDADKKEFTDLWKWTVEDAAVVGQKYVISPWLDQALRQNYDDMVRYMEVFNKSGELCKQSGMKFGYHNHDFEFSQKLNDTMVYDIILQNTDPALVMQQLDIGNMYNGGAKAEDILKKYPGRFESLHVKDEIKSAAKEGDAYESTVLGKGVINVKKNLELAKKHNPGTHLIIEQESYQGKTPLQSVKEDLAIMKKWGY
jgi:sugar phosphate isomerase/epimerase